MGVLYAFIHRCGCIVSFTVGFLGLRRNVFFPRNRLSIGRTPPARSKKSHGSFAIVRCRNRDEHQVVQYKIVYKSSGGAFAYPANLCTFNHLESSELKKLNCRDSRGLGEGQFFKRFCLDANQITFTLQDAINTDTRCQFKY